MKGRRLTLYIVCLVCVLFGAARLYYRLTDDFRLSNMTYEGLDYQAWQTPSLSITEQQHLAQVLQQPFYYIGKGAQCYAFGSQDQQYVLKFFKFKHLKPNLFVQLLPPIFPFKSYKEDVAERKKRKLEGVFDGYALAYRENKQDSELLYLHLVPTQNLKQHVTVVDKIGRKHSINLDDVVFLVQRKGETLRTRMNRQLKQHQVEEAQQSIEVIVKMYIQEYQKGLYDRDHGVMHNTGFVENRPFHLDVGKFSHEEQMRLVQFFKKDLEHVLWKIDTWVRNNYPEYYAQFSVYLDQQYQNYTGEALNIASIDPQRFKKKKH